MKKGEKQMKIAYLILAHRNPIHIRKMIDVLSSEDCSFFLHVDRKSRQDLFLFLKKENVFFSDKRISVYWAEYSMVEAILILIQQALCGPQSYDYYVLLSGSDYPLRSKEYIHNFFDKNRGMEFISMARIPNEEAGVPLSKIDTLAIPSSRPIYRSIVKACARLGLARRDYRKHLAGLQPYGGSTWWALTRDACEYILSFVKKNPSVCEYFEKTYTSDETFFHTILGNSILKSRVHRGLMYDDWPANSPHPVTINSEHLALFEAHEKVTLDDAFGPGELLFARKFSDDGIALVERIDEMMKRKDQRFGVG
jgi:hypothetical protein